MGREAASMVSMAMLPWKGPCPPGTATQHKRLCANGGMRRSTPMTGSWESWSNTEQVPSPWNAVHRRILAGASVLLLRVNSCAREAVGGGGEAGRWNRERAGRRSGQGTPPPPPPRRAPGTGTAGPGAST